MNNDALAYKPLILPPELVEVLRGQVDYTENSADIAELAIAFYQDGKDGADWWPLEVPEVPAWVRELMVRFLRACWEQGKRDAAPDATNTKSGNQTQSDT